MKRGGGLRRKTPLRARRSLRAKSKLKAKKAPERKTRLKKVNPKRLRRLRAMQFGTDGKREWVMAQLCCVTGHPGDPEWPIDPAHVGDPDPDAKGRTRATGAGPERLAPLWRPVHTDFDNLPADVFENKYGVSKTWVRQHAELLHEAWLSLPGERREWWAARARERAA